MLDFIKEESVWQKLRQEQRPIVLYGMGDGALKILVRCEQYKIPVAGIFASDEYVRGHAFAGFPVMRLSEAEERFDDFVILLCFAAWQPELLQKIYDLSARHVVLAPDVPVFGEGTFDVDFLTAHQDQFLQVHNLLVDAPSKQVLEDVLNFKLSGKIEYLTHCETPKSEVFDKILLLGKEESYFDLGAYDGDTITEFLSLTGGEYRRIVAVEPDRKNFKKLQSTFSDFSSSIELLHAGIWESDGTRRFDGRAGRNSALSESGKQEISVRSIDSIVYAASQPHCTFVKMDVEGAEYKALVGAQRTLRELRPKLAFSGYHRNEDLYALPLLLQDSCPDYQIYLRHHPYIPAWETNFYAV